jgi:hypothetical protein
VPITSTFEQELALAALAYPKTASNKAYRVNIAADPLPLFSSVPISLKGCKAHCRYKPCLAARIFLQFLRGDREAACIDDFGLPPASISIAKRNVAEQRKDLTNR